MAEDRIEDLCGLAFGQSLGGNHDGGGVGGKKDDTIRKALRLKDAFKPCLALGDLGAHAETDALERTLL